MSDRPTDPIARRDEVLELLYWFEGERFPGAATREVIVRFMACEGADVDRALAELIAQGDIEARPGVDGVPEHRLTDVGRREAARRFQEAFTDLLGQGHGECNDPTCDCHDDPGAAAECHAAKRHAH